MAIQFVSILSILISFNLNVYACTCTQSSNRRRHLHPFEDTLDIYPPFQSIMDTRLKRTRQMLEPHQNKPINPFPTDQKPEFKLPSNHTVHVSRSGSIFIKPTPFQIYPPQSTTNPPHQQGFNILMIRMFR